MNLTRYFTAVLGIAVTMMRIEADEYAGIKDKLSREPAITSRVVFNNGVPAFQINGQNYDRLLQYTCDYPWKYDNPVFVRQIGRFKDAGIHLYTVGFTICERTTGKNVAKEDGTAFEIDNLRVPDNRNIVRELWNGEYLALDVIEKRIYRSLQLDPDAYFMVYITLSYPNGWWMDKYPDELVRYANAPIDKSAKLGDYAFRAPSFASLIFRQQVCEILGKLVSYLEATPAAKRVFAYRVDHGCFREWFQWGFTDNLLPDVSQPMLRAFREYLREFYKDDVSALRKAWNDPGVIFDTAQFPSPEERMRLGEDFLRDPISAAPVLDYLRALHGEILKTNLAFNRTVKEASNNRVAVGNYGGYFFGMHFGPEHRHFHNAELLRSKLVDFQISPFMYTKFRKMGESGFAENMFESTAMNGVMPILEADTSTHLDTDKARKISHLIPDNNRDASMLLARDFGQILARKGGIQWKDFNKQFYDDDEIQKTFAVFSRINKLSGSTNQLKSSVAVVGDFESLIYMCARRWDKLYPQVVSDLQMELSHSGASFETIAFTDLEKSEANHFQVYIFPNLFYVTPEKLAMVEKLKTQGKILFFSYAPGYLTPSGRSLKSMNKLLGGDFKNFPGVFTRGKIVNTAPNIYYSTDGRWPRNQVRELFRKNSIHIYNTDSEPVIFAGGNFLTVHTAQGGKQTITLPRRMKISRCFPEFTETVDTMRFEFNAPEKSTIIFYVR